MSKQSESKAFALEVTAPIWCAVIWSLSCRWFVGPFYGEAMNQGAMALYFMSSVSWVLGGIFVCLIVFSINEEIAKNRKAAIWAMYFVSLIIPFVIGKM